jgi:hypothetical protein
MATTRNDGCDPAFEAPRVERNEFYSLVCFTKKKQEISRYDIKLLSGFLSFRRLPEQRGHRILLRSMKKIAHLHTPSHGARRAVSGGRVCLDSIWDLDELETTTIYHMKEWPLP